MLQQTFSPAALPVAIPCADGVVLGGHFRMAYQAIRGNWAKCIHVASRNLYFDSHSDNTRS